MQRCFTNILSDNVDATARFYEHILNMSRHYDSDWFVILTHESIDGLELGILQRDHEVVPKPVQNSPSGIIITFVVADCDQVYNSALESGATIIEPPTNMPYGQRRFLVLDPAGTTVDVSSLVS